MLALLLASMTATDRRERPRALTTDDMSPQPETLPELERDLLSAARDSLYVSASSYREAPPVADEVSRAYERGERMAGTRRTVPEKTLRRRAKKAAQARQGGDR